MIFDLPPEPPKLWLPPKPAIIRQATPDLLVPHREPLSRNRRRGVGGKAATISFLGFYENDANQTIYNFAAVNIGTPGNARHIGAVAIHSGSGGPAGSSITVDGAPLAVAVSALTSSLRLEIWMGAVDTANSSGTVTVTWAAGSFGMVLALFECHNIISAAARATDTEATDNTAMTAAALGGGIAIGAAAVGASSTFTWTGDGVKQGEQPGVGGNIDTSVAMASYATGATATMTADSTTTTSYIAALATFR